MHRDRTSKASDQALDFCDRRFKGAFEWQDCVEGINLMRRLLRKGASSSAAAKGASRLCETKNEFPGPKARCVAAVKVFARKLGRKR